MRIALLGTRGVPARYGGFETVVEELGAGLVKRGHEVVVYCRQPWDTPSYRGMQRVVLPAIHRTALETLTHTLASAAHAVRHRPDAAVVFNAANAPAVRVLTAARIPTALHVDGHDGRRAKWRGAGQRYYSVATRWGARVADRVVVDSEAIGQELTAAHGRTSVFIPYGAKRTVLTDDELRAALGHHGLTPGAYHLVVARFEPENHVLDIVRAFAGSPAQLPLVLVGFAGYPGGYVQAVAEESGRDDRVRSLGAVWDQQLLDALYTGATSYVHGHSVGGTNPSLLRAMAHGAPVLAYECPYNRETTCGSAGWWATPRELSGLLSDLERNPAPFLDLAAAAQARALSAYRWPEVVDAYELLVADLSGRSASPSASPIPPMLQPTPQETALDTRT